MGHTVNFKTSKKSFKSKRIIHNPEDKQVIFENTHEAIIDYELWEVVQKIREQRHRPTRTGETALFSGLIFCADCGCKLNLHRQRTDGNGYHSYVCSQYRNSRGKQKCSAHYIRESVLNNLVLENLRGVIAYAKDYEEEFVHRIMSNTLAEQTKQQTAFKRQLEQQTRRIGEIDAIIQHLYEDMVKGTLTSERFTKMSATYEQEQRELEISTAELRETVNACENQKVNIKSFLRIARSYIEPEELTPDVLRLFVEKVIVHEADRSSGERIQQVEIHYNFVGQLDVSAEMVKTGRWTKEEIFRRPLSGQQAI